MIRAAFLIGACLTAHAVERMALLEVRAYCPCIYCCGAGARGITSTGTSCRRHPFGVAVDPGRFAYGTSFKIPGYDLPATADDTGGALRSGIGDIEVRFKTHKEAKAWGVQYLLVTITERD